MDGHGTEICFAEEHRFDRSNGMNAETLPGVVEDYVVVFHLVSDRMTFR